MCIMSKIMFLYMSYFRLLCTRMLTGKVMSIRFTDHTVTEEPPAKKTFIKEFMDFLQAFSVIGLAIAFVIGQAASKLITAFVNDMINPFIGLLTPGIGDLNEIKFNVGNSTFSYGDLISNIINFLIIALVVFIAYKQLSKFGLMQDPTKKK